MAEKSLRSPRFAILFLLTLGAVSVTVFFVFSDWQRKMATLRREESRANLEAINLALRAYKKDKGSFPEHAVAFTRAYIAKDSTLIHAAWPEQPGYMYVPGVRAGDPTEAYILVYENVPARKLKLGVQVLHLNGCIETLSERQFVDALNAQESVWRKSGRAWAPESMVRGKE